VALLDIDLYVVEHLINDGLVEMWKNSVRVNVILLHVPVHLLLPFLLHGSWLCRWLRRLVVVIRHHDCYWLC